MDTQAWIIIGAAVVAVAILIAVAFALATRRSRRRATSRDLREQFGHEYDVTVAELGRRDGEAALRERRNRFDDLELDRIRPDRRRAATERWKELQYRFVEDPGYSVREAEHLVTELMRDRGYPAGGVDGRAEAMSVDHPDLAQPYRDAYATFRAVEDDHASLADMYRAVVTYRAVVEALLERPQHESGVEGTAPPETARAFAGPRG